MSPAAGPPRLRVGVIGGGIAGLTAAYRFAQRGHQVTLWERGPRLGGQAAAFPVLGTAIEYFYHHLFMSDHDIVQLMNEIGIGDDLIWLPSPVGFFADGKIYPLSGAFDLLRLGCIPLIDRLRVGFTTLYLQKLRDWRRFEHVTAAEWLRRAVGQRAFDRVWGAQLRAKFGPRYDQVAMVWFWNKIYLRTQSRPSLLAKEKLGYIRGSFNTLIDRLAEVIAEQGATIKVGVGTDRLERRDNEWLVRTSEGEEVTCDVIVATVPSPILAKLFPDLPEDYKAKLTGAVYQAAVTMLLQTTRPLSHIYWLNIGDPSVPFTGIIEHTNFIGPEHYQGRHLIYVSKYVEHNHPYLTTPDDQLFAEYVPYLQRINPAFSPDWVERYWVFREYAAQPIITKNYSARIPEHRTPLPGLYLANTAQIYPEDRGTNYSVRIGNVVADLVEQDLRAGLLRPGTATAASNP
ncbi:NAD(P)/FAD-dependent oxidoreductase [Sphaerobacter sp.]|uniref:NAD(P)/FAD-dependent oxidoreductase n=1 Tax=Sphaerobacter sp. TaxID=2099654 RepID=UPI001D4E9AF9|nr:NAD(P)/FAD-dependent oxidoreductase [Sphaerobacter sp.]MBX5445655.1 NAD(P)/FAD-dependent oxidoreductase [Sphaerobacter sp.]